METTIVYLPNAEGVVEDIENIAWDCHERGQRLTLRAERLALALLRDPKEWGADEVEVADRYHLPADMPDAELRAMAERVHSRATYLGEMVQAYGMEQENVQFFDAIRIDPPTPLKGDVSIPGIEVTTQGEYTLIRVLPTVTLDDMNTLIEMLADCVGAMAQPEEDDEAFDGLWALEESWCRE